MINIEFILATQAVVPNRNMLPMIYYNRLVQIGLAPDLGYLCRNSSANAQIES